MCRGEQNRYTVYIYARLWVVGKAVVAMSDKSYNYTR